jgi:rod shape determining protein RodA
MINYLKKLDWILIISVFLLSVLGLVCIYSISSGTGSFLNFKKQIGFIVLGFFLMMLLGFFDWRGFRDNSYFLLILYLICCLLLFGLLIFVPEIRGIRSWYKIGPFSFDPIGLSTIVLVMLLAKFFSKRHVEMYKLRHIILSGFYAAIPFFLIAFQPDLGGALIMLAIWGGILVISGIKLKHFFVLIFLGIIVFTASWSLFLKDYQKNRIVGFLTPQTEVLGINWSQTQSKIAIGSGGIFGQGFGQGSQTQHGFLSEPYTDFIFSVLAEEFGLVGIFVLLLLFSTLLFRITKTALQAESNFPRLFASGLAIFIFVQFFIHVGMNLGILPVIGLPLPMVSYGGSNLIAIFIGLGILQSIKVSQK